MRKWRRKRDEKKSEKKRRNREKRNRRERQQSEPNEPRKRQNRWRESQIRLKRKPKRKQQQSVHQKGSLLWNHLQQPVQRRVELMIHQVVKSTPIFAACFVHYDQDETGADWVSFACGRWLHEDCVVYVL